MKKPKHEPEQQEWYARSGLNHLRRALAFFRESDNKQTAKRVRLAISSAKGAVRICGYRVTRARRADER